ncbi:M48 family metallopeptidase [Rubritalea marina]|uniref:M48 family metallopeptidase n=1 Tax=Rubritalea marina TaxID=361055 RepID=UPI000527F219|nr:M48 family metallopeptidase [Rubritalea marina]
MSMDNLLGLIIALVLFLLWKIDLAATLLNLKALKPELPDEFNEVFTQEKYAKSQEYTRTNSRFHLIESSFSLALTLGFWFSGGFGWLDQFLRGYELSSLVTGLCYIGLLGFGQMILNLPFKVYSTFVIEAKFGFNKTTAKTFIIDQVKGATLSLLIGIPILAAILWIFNSVEHAWLWAWITLTAIQLLLTYLAPTYILPLFNTFEPMPDGELKSAINEVAKKCEFPLTEIHVMDGSKRSTKSNAFFTGFGKNKKIALFDTLIEGHSTQGLVGILAHEIGHFKCKHIIQRLITGIIQTAAIFFLIGLVTDPDSAIAQTIFHSFYIDDVTPYAGLVIFFILFAPVQSLLSIFANMSSRKHEFEADAYAANAQGSSEYLIDSLKKLSADNLVNLTPHPMVVFMEYSHPPMLVRINALRALKFP